MPAIALGHNRCVPRSNRPRRGGRRAPAARPAPLDVERALGSAPRRQGGDGREWFVRPVSGAGSTKTYRCPGCEQEIPPGVAHLVVWPADDLLGEDSAVADRRHWHRPCWQARSRRRPRR